MGRLCGRWSAFVKVQRANPSVGRGGRRCCTVTLCGFSVVGASEGGRGSRHGNVGQLREGWVSMQKNKPEKGMKGSDAMVRQVFYEEGTSVHPNTVHVILWRPFADLWTSSLLNNWSQINVITDYHLAGLILRIILDVFNLSVFIRIFPLSMNLIPLSVMRDAFRHHSKVSKLISCSDKSSFIEALISFIGCLCVEHEAG